MANKKVVKTICLVFSLMLALFSNTGAQISLNSTSFATVGTGTDSLRVSLYSAVLPVLPAATAETWDMTAIVDSLPYFWHARVNSSFYQYADSNEYSLGAYWYQGNAGVNIAGSGIIEAEVEIKKREYNLSFLTASLLDTLFIPAQTVANSTPLIHLGFPATYNSVWQSNYSNSTTYELTVGMFSYVHKPFVRRRYVQRRDTVKGWGKMKVRNAAGFSSDYFDVLQIFSTTITTDSFFTDGVPAVPSVVTMFSLEQGKKDTSYVQRYYRAQEVTPLATIVYRDAGYTQPVKATTHIQRLKVASVDKVTDKETPIIYPNPTSDGCIYLTNLPTIGESSYILTDVKGNRICSGIIDNNKLPSRVELPKWLSNGIYLLNVSNDHQPIGKYSIHINR